MLTMCIPDRALVWAGLHARRVVLCNASPTRDFDPANPDRSMTTATDGSAAFSELVLKTTPPRAPRNLLARPRLSLEDEQFRDRTVILLQAPPGFGKTSLLAQWRHEFL